MRQNRVIETALAEDTLLARYNPDANPRLAVGYADCFNLEIDREISFDEYVLAFYTSRIFKLERWLLGVLLRATATDDDARQLASGAAQAYSFWTVEARQANQLLMCDKSGSTRSWLMTSNAADTDATMLHFGSAVIAKKNRRGEMSLGPVFHALLWFHKGYSKVLLKSAARRLARGR